MPALLTPEERTARMRAGRWGRGPSPWSTQTRWNAARERELGASAALLPSTPAHLRYLYGNGAWVFPPWLVHLNEVVTEFLLRPGEGFLAIEVPVRHGKSEYVTVAVPAWFLGMFPDRRVLMTSYSHSLIKGFSGDVLQLLSQLGPSLFGFSVRANQKNDEWAIDGHRHSMRAVPRGGGVTGFGGHLIIIDDPIKDEREADSKLERERLWNWYTRRLRNRLEPGGKVIMVMARWHADDLRARLFDPNYQTEMADHWELVHLPALAEPSPEEHHAAKQAGLEIDLEEWRDELGRAHGEPLWPERWPKKKLRTLQASVGPRGWASNFQQVPILDSSGMFPKHKWDWAEELPLRCDLVRRWDLAATKDGDWTASALVGMDGHAFTYIADVRRRRMVATEVQEWARSVVEEDERRYGKGRVHNVIEQEPGSSGLAVAEEYVREIFAGHSSEKRRTSGKKELLAGPLAGQVGAGNVRVVQVARPDGVPGAPAWFDDFADEAADFPYGAHDDQIDVVTKAYNDLVERREKRRKRKSRTSTVAGRSIGGGGGSGPRR